MPLLKTAVFLACLLPLARLVWLAMEDGLGPNPVEFVTHDTGAWGLRLLWLTLAMTPLRMASGWSGFVRLRRMLGLFSFFYVGLHLLVWLWLDRELDWAGMLVDIAKRPYITVGFTAFLLMLPLAITSNRWSMQRLGRRWKRLHQLVYTIAVLGVLHFLWLVKADVREPILYGILLVVLLAFRTSWIRGGDRRASLPGSSLQADNLQ